METAANNIEDLANNALGMRLRQIPKKDSTHTHKPLQIILYQTDKNLASGVSPILALRWGLEFERNLGWKDKIRKLFFEEISAFSFDMRRFFHAISCYKKMLERFSTVKICSSGVSAKSFSQRTTDL